MTDEEWQKRYCDPDPAAIAAKGSGDARTVRMADILVSYTSSERDWAFWIGHELEALGHKARIHGWEIAGGGDIPAWVEERHHAADHVLCVVSKRYLKAAYSSWERRAAQWAAATEPHRDSGSAGPPIRGIETGACAAPRRLRRAFDATVDAQFLAEVEKFGLPVAGPVSGPAAERIIASLYTASPALMPAAQ